MFAANKAQSLRFTPEAEGTCIVEGDEARLRDSIDNLVTNAIKYSPPGKPILIAVRRQNDQVTVSVTDEGPGLTPEDRSKLFRKFQRLSPQPTAGESSTGLGLSVTKEIIEMHGGTIRVESEPGKGSTFTIELPSGGAKETGGGEDC
jgi:signal transduction histidine kinase